MTAFWFGFVLMLSAAVWLVLLGLERATLALLAWLDPPFRGPDVVLGVISAVCVLMLALVWALRTFAPLPRP